MGVWKTATFLGLLTLTGLSVAVHGDHGSLGLQYSATDLSFLFNETDIITVKSNNVSDRRIYFTSEDKDRVTVHPNYMVFSSQLEQNLTLIGLSPGHVLINVTDYDVIEYLHVTVLRSFEMRTFSDVIGWFYFVAWSLSFYPQLYLNFKRKSVVGLNFDFVFLNVIGFFLYSVYNACLYWNQYVQDLYLDEHVGGLLPILINDIVFSFHAAILCFFVVIQCFIYEKGNQSLSLFGKCLIGFYAAFILVSLICTATDVSPWLTWLRFLEFCSYVKLSITIIKYMPQAYMNYKRKSTHGWSIINILLDFTGGVLSMGQMLVNAWNYDDWSSIFGDPTKFGLGLFSVLFDLLFMVQHYILYRHTTLKEYGVFSESPGNSRSELSY